MSGILSQICASEAVWTALICTLPRTPLVIVIVIAIVVVIIVVIVIIIARVGGMSRKALKFPRRFHESWQASWWQADAGRRVA